MVGPKLERLIAYATLDDPEEGVGQAREAASRGDGSWAEWLEQLERGNAVIARLAVRAEIAHEDGRLETVDIGNRGVWLETVAHAPTLEADVAEIANKDAEALASELRARGVETSPEGVGRSYFHVELGEDLRGAGITSHGGEGLRGAGSGEVAP